MSKEKCNDLIVFFNEAYKNYKNKKFNSHSCLKKVHMHETSELIIKIPDNNQVLISIPKEDEIYKPLGFVLSNINNNIFTGEKPNDWAFKLLELILNILDSYNLKSNTPNKRISKKKLLDNININKNMTSLIQLGNYIFTIPKKIKYEFKVYGLELARLKVKKIKIKNKLDKNKKIKIIKNKNKK